LLEKVRDTMGHSTDIWVRCARLWKQAPRQAHGTTVIQDASAHCGIWVLRGVLRCVRVLLGLLATGRQLSPSAPCRRRRRAGPSSVSVGSWLTAGPLLRTNR
jgi:hypothetical protein